MPFQSKNMHYVFNAEYLETLTSGKIADASTRLNGEVLDLANGDEIRQQILAYGEKTIEQLTNAGAMQKAYTVLYPGVLMGTGYPHMTKMATGEIQLGFTFDYVTGAPYYPGSSLKGVLRAPFERAVPVDGAPDDGVIGYLKGIIVQAVEGRLVESDITEDVIRDFRDEVFEGLDVTMRDQGKTLPMSQRDIFYGAFLTATEEKHKKIIGLDSLTPHQDSIRTEPADEEHMEHVILDEDVTKDPIPLTMLRLLPKTVLTVCMKLTDGAEFSGEEKFRILCRIIEDFGIGAKTNVGYGVLEPYKKSEKICSKCGKSTTDWQEVEGKIFCEECSGSLVWCARCHEHLPAINPNTKQPGKYCKQCMDAIKQEREKERGTAKPKSNAKPGRTAPQKNPPKPAKEEDDNPFAALKNRF